MFVHEVHLVTGEVIKIQSPDELPVVEDLSGNLLKFSFANGNTYTFVATNVIYYATRKDHRCA